MVLSAGLITRWQAAGSPGVPLLHQLQGAAQQRLLVGHTAVHRPRRAEAIAAMRQALAEFYVEGIKTTISTL